MESQRWKKVALSGLVCILLVFTFWYGGGSKASHGFSVTEEATTQSTSTTSSNEATTETTKVAKESEQSEQTATTEEQNVFQKFFMNITLKSSSKKDSPKKSHKKKSNKNLQNNKSVQNNANKATDKAKKKSKKKTTKKKNTNNKNSDNKGETKSNTNSNNKNTNKKDNNANNKNTNKTDDGEEDANQSSNNSKTDRQDDSNIESDSSKENNNNSTPAQQQDNQQQDIEEDDKVTCTIYISCATLLDHMDELSQAKRKQVPGDGIILKKTTVTVDEGSTVFDVLCKVAKKKNIQLEYSFTPAFKSYYIEGIHNLYEFDGGQLSGWMYSVNDDFPGFGCSAYELKDGDEIKWLYTCDLGKDVGGYFGEE